MEVIEPDWGKLFYDLAQNSNEEIKQILIDETYQRVKNANKFNIHEATKYDVDKAKDYEPTKLNLELADNIDERKVNKLIT